MRFATKVEGLSEFQRNLKKLDRELPKALRMALNDAANVIVDEAKPKVPRRSGRAAGTVKAKSTQKMARVSGGGNRAPYYPWLDFGGSVGKSHSVKRPFIPDGRYIYKAYFGNREKFREVLDEALIDVVRKAGLEVD